MSVNNEGIAIVGMACQFPGAGNIFEYWDNLINGRETITLFSDGELERNEYDYLNLRNRNDYVKARGILKDIDKWDSGFFGYTPQEAANSDPQQRLWLQTVWSAFEDAGCNPYQYKGVIGVYAGTVQNTYLLNNILRNPAMFENYIRSRSADCFQIYLNNESSYLATKTAYVFDLKGPAITVQTACSTSLVAIAQACSSLSSFETDICLAGGVTVLVPQETGYIYQEGAITSPDGHCRPFDVNSNGTVFSNGVGVVVLKRIDDAIKDKNRIYGVIKGWALNNDGKDKVGFTAPRVDGQAEVISMAQSFAGVNPEDISYIEAHGTATPLGDPIEVSALAKAFQLKTNKKQFCGIGSVKSNIGHLDAAAGIAGFIKVALSTYYHEIPPTINFTSPNPRLNIENTPFYVADKLQTVDKEKSLIIGVSSFGVGGTNAHVIVQDYPESITVPPIWPKPQLILLSAKSDESLKSQIENHIDFINNNPGITSENIAYTLQTGRLHMQLRAFAILNNKQHLVFDDFKKAEVNEFSKQLVFMFPGQGAQFINMGKDLYEAEHVFKKQMDECFSVYYDITGSDIKTVLFKTKPDEISESVLSKTEITQPALFIVEYSLAKLYIHYGIEPDYMIGHSIGEYVAACLSGVFDLTTALKVVIKRGQLMQSMPPGKMMAVRTCEEELLKIKSSLFEIAAINSPGVCTISFQLKNHSAIKNRLDEASIQYIELNTSHAFHSSDFDPILPVFEKYVSSFQLNGPDIPFISCLTGELISLEEAIAPGYWARQLRSTVQFNKGITKFSENEETIFMEIGPNTHLSANLRNNDVLKNKAFIITSLGKPDIFNEQEKFLQSLGNLWLVGKMFNFGLFFNGSDPRLISLPGYPFDKKRHWVDFKLTESTAYQTNKIISNINNSFSSSTVSDTARMDNKESIPNGKVTDKILNIWRSVIGINQIGLDDNFFELGGHSLLALQIIARIKEEFGQDISLKEFLNSPTINKLSLFFEEKDVSYVIKTEKPSLVDLSNQPLSLIQKRIWIISQLDPLNPAYNIPFTYKFTGNLNADIFQKSINLLFERHFPMHSVFKEKNGEPFCEIVQKPVTITQIDFSDLPKEESILKIDSFVSGESRQPFNFESGPLYRLFLIKQDKGTSFFHASIHHLIFDGWSWSIFIMDIKKIYEGLLLNKKIEIDNVRDHYFEYFRLIQEGVTLPHEEESIRFWIENLKGCSKELRFPYDYQRKIVPSGFGGKEHFEVSSGITLKLRELSKKKNTTLFATLFSSIGILFNKYSGDSDICIGTHVANRTHSNFESIFGMFVNTIPVRLIIDGKLIFSDFIDYAKNVLLDSISHQDTPFEKIVEEVNPIRSSNINPLFQVSIVWLTNSAIELDLEGVKTERIFVSEGISPFDITFNLWENENIIKGEIEYNIDILKRETMTRFKRNFIYLLNSIACQPDQPISGLFILSEKDRQRLTEFNKTEVPVNDCLIQDLFEKQSIQHPFATAVISGGSRLTYKELNNRSNQLAGYLISLGVAKGDIVGIFIERSVEMVVSVLGVLKAGCCYLPLDPSFPQERLNYMIEDSGARFIVSQSSLTKKIKNSPISSLILIDDQKEKICSCTADKPVISINSDHPAYIIYTSGSTGNPKGVVVFHHSVVNFLKSMSKVPGIEESDKLLAVTTLSFDISVLEIFLPLLKGATIVVAGTEDISDGMALAKILDSENITFLQATPATWTLLMNSGWKGNRKMKALCGGEAISSRLVKELLPAVDSLWNMYGPTETTVWSTCYQIKDTDQPVLVGKPIDNTKVYILNKENRIQPIGVIGEVCIGGLGVSGGYHNNPDLTGEKFVKFENGATIYKTGDLGRFLDDGNIELFGRSDNQIKLRGFRIEPGEIENHLTNLPHIEEAVVKLHRFEDNDDRLVAFLNIDSEFVLTDKEIVGSLANKLPSYMVPAFFQMGTGFPRLPNGKINKKALVFKTSDLKQVAGSELESLTDTQKKLMVIWQNILKVRTIKATDSFFNAGGNSLLAISLLNRIKEHIGYILSFKDIISYPNIALLANFIDNNFDSKDEVINLIHLTETENLPLTINQKRLWIITRLNPDIPTYIIPITYRLSGSLDFVVFNKSIEILFQRHYIFFSVIKEKDGEPYCNIFPEKVRVEFIDYSDLDEDIKNERIIDFIDQESVKIFNLEVGPLYRLYLIKTGRNEYYFHLSIHHIIFDGWSMKVLINDLNRIYNSLLNNTYNNLEDLMFQQFDFAYWEIQSQKLINEDKAINFWTNYLQGITTVFNFPYDNPRKILPSGLGGRERFQLADDLSRKIKSISRNENVSTFGTLLSTYAILLQRYSGENDICIGTPVAYRPHSRLEEVIGMFVNTIVIRATIEPDKTFKKIVHSINESLVSALAYQYLPFEKIVDIVKPERLSNINPIFQMVFAWQDNLGIPIQFKHTQSSRVVGKNGTSVFDLSLFMWENGNFIEGEIEFNKEIIKRETALRLKENFLTLIGQLVEKPDVPLESLSMISDEEVMMIHNFNNTSSDYPKDRTIVQLFEDQVLLYPHKIAIAFKGNALTYKELSQQTNQLANTLRKKGVCRNEPVGLLAEKSLEMIVGILGILKAGGAYVPIDPEYPEQRINFIIKDSGCKFLLTQKKFMNTKLDNIKMIDLNSTEIYNIKYSNFDTEGNTSDIAYIMYTSGTTGVPKGCIIPQRGVVRLVCHPNYIDLTPEDNILMTGAIVFDATTFEIWGALLNGGTLYIAEKETILNVKVFAEALIKNNITVLWLTSALFTQITELRTDIFRKLKYLLVGGDVLSSAHINKARKYNPELKIINGYGPTENTTFSTTYLIERDYDKSIPIGKPISNSSAYIFDRNMNLQPIGVIGELYVGGDGVSLGYLNRNDLNEKYFINNPYHPGERLYRTGDYAKWLSDGNIEFHGRIDNQLKIRGFRVELEEIESVISEIDDVIETVIKPFRSAEGDYKLIAFLNVHDKFKMETEEIERLIKVKLPAYMVPSAYKFMKGFKRTINGKIDKKSLTFDICELGNRHKKEVQILTPIEKVIYDIWCKALNTKDITVNDNFFHIGGNSLLAISVFSKIESNFNVEFGLRNFFDSPKIKDLAEIIDIALNKSTEPRSYSQKRTSSKTTTGEI
jgi:amino acid adenylation domain-containing protein